MDLLYAAGISKEGIAWVYVAIISMGVMGYLRVMCGRVYRYRDPSGFMIVKDRRTGKEYVETNNRHLRLLE